MKSPEDSDQEGLEIRVSKLEGEVRHVTSIVEKMDRKLDGIAAGGKFTWQTFGVIFAMFVALSGGGAFFVNLATQPLSEAAKVSIKDRDELHQSTSVNSEKIAESNFKIERLQAALAEVETQFRASDQVRNIQFANQLRLDALMWEKIFGDRFPSDIQYYPQISQKNY